MINFQSQKLKSLYKVTILLMFFVIFLSSFAYLYENRSKILKFVLIKVGADVAHGHGHHDEKRFLINPLKQSDRQIPPINIQDLKINNDSEVYGQWSAPIDWNVTAIHSILLPDETVMTFGTSGIESNMKQ